jgi:hypothetical protein
VLLLARAGAWNWARVEIRGMAEHWLSMWVVYLQRGGGGHAGRTQRECHVQVTQRDVHMRLSVHKSVPECNLYATMRVIFPGKKASGGKHQAYGRAVPI